MNYVRGSGSDESAISEIRNLFLLVCKPDFRQTKNTRLYSLLHANLRVFCKLSFLIHHVLHEENSRTRKCCQYK